MMVPKKSLILAGAALALFGASATAQSQASGKVFSRYNKPLQSVSLDLATGTISRGPAVNNRAASTTVDFNNNDLGGFVGVDTGNGFCEWFDAAVKGFAGNASDLMNNFVFAYCSAMLAAGSGGPGGSVKLGFYEGYTWGGGAATTTVAAFTLTALPANTSSSSFFNGFRCFFIQVEFATLIPFADGPIGYSWRFLDLGTTGTFAGTWPFLACSTSCSAIAPPTIDVIDRYCPPGTLVGSFTFGTTSGNYSSMSMEIREAADLAATITPYNSTTAPNSDLLSSSLSIIGRDWTFFLTRSPASSAGTFVVNLRPNRIPLPAGVAVPPPVQGRLLVSGPVLGQFTGSHDGLTGTVTVPVPAQLGYLCQHFAAQAVVLGGGVELSSAVEGTSGTF